MTPEQEQIAEQLKAAGIVNPFRSPGAVNEAARKEACDLIACQSIEILHVLLETASPEVKGKVLRELLEKRLVEAGLRDKNAPDRLCDDHGVIRYFGWDEILRLLAPAAS